MSKTGIKRIIFFCLVFFLVLLFSASFVITRVCNTPRIKNKISRFINQETGLKIDSYDLSFTLLPQTTLRIEDLNLFFNKTTELKINSVDIIFQALPLIFGNIKIDHISVNAPKVLFSSLPNETSGTLPDIPISEFMGYIEKAHTFFSENLPVIDIRFNHFQSRFFKRMDGSLLFSKETEKMYLTATLKNLHINPAELVNSDFKKYVTITSVALDQIDFHTEIGKQGFIKGECSFGPLKLTSEKNQILLDSDTITTSFSISKEGSQIDIKPFQPAFPKGMFEMHFTTDPPRGSKIEFTGTGINIDEVRSASQMCFKNNSVVSTLFEIVHGGMADKVNVVFESRELENLFDEHHLFLTGNCKNAVVAIPETTLWVNGIDAAVKLEKGILAINAGNARIQGSKVKKGKLEIDLLNYKDYPFKGEFLLDIDLSKIPETLISLLPDTLLAKELSRVRNVKGRAGTRLKLNLKTKSKALDVGVSTDVFSATGSYNRIPGNLSLERVVFQYAKNKAKIKNLDGTFLNSVFKDLNFSLDFQHKTRMKIESGSGTISLKTIIPWLSQYKEARDILSRTKAIGGGKNSRGNVHIASMNIEGPVHAPESWKYDIQGKGIGIDLPTDLLTKQIENMSFQYHLSNGSVQLQNLKSEIHDLAFLKSMDETEWADTISVPFNVTRGDLYMDSTKAGVNLSLLFATGPELQLELTGKALSSLTPVRIEFRDKGLSNAFIAFPQTHGKSRLDYSGILNTRTIHKVLRPENDWNKTITRLAGKSPVILHTDTDSNLNIIARHINLDALLLDSNSFDSSNYLLPDRKIHLKTDTLLFKKLLFNNVDSTIVLQKGSETQNTPQKNDIRINQADLCGLGIKGTIKLQQGKIDSEIWTEAENKPNIQDVLTCLFQEARLMDGRYSFTSHSLFTGDKGSVKKGVNGPLVLSAWDGRIHKLTLLSRIFSVLNVSNIFQGKIPDVMQEGFAYKNISIEADVKNSIIYLKKAIIDGQDMTLIFSGWIDPIQDTIELVCLVAPFKTIDLIIEKIPILNTLMEGRLISIPVKATGKRLDPEVIPLHPTAVKQGIVNMMSNILKTPVKLWDKAISEKTDEKIEIKKNER